MKRRGHPPKPKIPRLPLSKVDIEDTAGVSLQATQDPDPKHNCWFTPREDGKSDMDIAADWCSVYANFHEWRTKPKNLVGEKLAIFLVSQDHPNREARECQKKVCHPVLCSF